MENVYTIIHKGGDYATCETCKFFTRSKDSDEGSCQYQKEAVSKDQPACSYYVSIYANEEEEEEDGYDK